MSAFITPAKECEASSKGELATGFPLDPWELLKVREPVAFALELQTMLVERLCSQGSPREPAALAEFLGTQLSPGKILLHGAGTHSEQVLQQLAERADIEVIGFVDKWADRIQRLGGHAVLRPEQVLPMIETGEVDYVLLSSPLWETQMRDALLAVGVPAHKIQAIYADPRYAALAMRAALPLLDALPIEAEYVLLDFGREGQSLIADQDLAGILPPDRTLRLHSERFEVLGGRQVFASFGFRNSLHLLAEMLGRLQPRVVYLRTFIDDNFLSVFVMNVLPSARLVHEVYDFSLTIPERFLRGAYGHSERSIQMAYSGEYHSFQRAEYVIGKRAGPLWELVAGGQHAPYAAYFAQLPARENTVSKDACDAPGTGQDLRLVYAGNLPSQEVLEQEMASRLLPLFRELHASGGLQISVFNGAHRSCKEDAQFAYIADLLGSGISYSPAVPYLDLLARMQEYHYGWLYVPREKIDFIDELVLVSNRFTGYICAGLPVVIDDGWDCMADLVRRFDAGIVVSMLHPEDLAGALAIAQVERHRRGALALRDHMQRSNRAVLQLLKSRVSV